MTGKSSKDLLVKERLPFGERHCRNFVKVIPELLSEGNTLLCRHRRLVSVKIQTLYDKVSGRFFRQSEWYRRDLFCLCLYVFGDKGFFYVRQRQKMRNAECGVRNEGGKVPMTIHNRFSHKALRQPNSNKNSKRGIRLGYGIKKKICRWQILQNS